MTVIEVAAYGWQGGEWDEFYPEGIPDEWRLDYYANEFFAVVVPICAWMAVGDEELLEWQQQVSDDFRFYWEVPADATRPMARLQHLLSDDEFGAHWGGVVCFDKATAQPQISPAGESPSLLRLDAVLELRPLRMAIEEALTPGGKALLVVVLPTAFANLRPARDIAQLLGGG